jgi:hypothetical protein
LGRRRASRRLSFSGPYFLLHFFDGSRDVEDEGKGGLARREQSAHYLLRAGRYLNIGSGDDQPALRERRAKLFRRRNSTTRQIGGSVEDELPGKKKNWHERGVLEGKKAPQVGSEIRGEIGIAGSRIRATSRRC